MATDNSTADNDIHSVKSDNQEGEDKEFNPEDDYRSLPKINKTQTGASTIRLDRDNIYLNEIPIPKEDFQNMVYAFGGTLNPGARRAPLREFGNPVPAGLFCFSLTCFTLGLIECGARGVTDPSILIGSCLCSSGLVLFICAIWCLIVENTWGSVVLFGFGGFWSAYGIILCDTLFGVSSAYETTQDFNNAVGLLFAGYVIFSFLLWVCTFKSTVPFFLLFFFVWFFILLLDIGIFTGHTGVTKAGGVFCFITGILGFYNAFSGMADKSNSYFVVHPWFMPGAAKPKDIEMEERL
ncbi:hypothetical protein PACTADRAFT_48383 [Pachysolen tannophilus NRRL Y-2460]|uniref:Uncharacterized protein n=1 Tax=Pachysolen tannophilus NRRL Y-2460 TaxID=669874 RepID=A0A1E4TXS6_PACTA|nr:hypothetical protein PACTADRAFT_48383 [Pachysolen tannophilus NRRL Y-2460]